MIFVTIGQINNKNSHPKQQTAHKNKYKYNHKITMEIIKPHTNHII
jgi:hypothetical protein